MRYFCILLGSVLGNGIVRGSGLFAGAIVGGIVGDAAALLLAGAPGSVGSGQLQRGILRGCNWIYYRGSDLRQLDRSHRGTEQNRNRFLSRRKGAAKNNPHRVL